MSLTRIKPILAPLALAVMAFSRLQAEVALKHCGALLSLEVSRLARSCSDWYHLLEICALTDTLVIDEDGIYDPGHYNDRLLLGLYIRYHKGARMRVVTSTWAPRDTIK